MNALLFALSVTMISYQNHIVEGPKGHVGSPVSQSPLTAYAV
jgi:hypothetical protein